MVGIVKKFISQGFGIIKASDGSKLAFVLSDFAQNQIPREGLSVIFSICTVKGEFFASHVIRGEASNAV